MTPEDVIEEQLDQIERQIVADIMSDEGVALPQVGSDVWYQTDGRNGLDYYLPAKVSVTRDSHPGDYPDGTPNSLPVPTSRTHVHLTVFTPGGFGSIYKTEEGESGWSDYQQEDLDNLGRPASFAPGSGTYVEHDVPFDPRGTRRSWRWPETKG